MTYDFKPHLSKGEERGATGAQPSSPTPVTSLVENYAKKITNSNFKNFRACKYIVGKVFSRPFQHYTISPQIPKILVGKFKKYLQLFSDYKVGWSKEPQWENDCDSFCNIFYECIEGKSGICL